MATKIIQLTSKVDNAPVYIRTSSDGVNCDPNLWKDHGINLQKTLQAGKERVILTQVLQQTPQLVTNISSQVSSQQISNLKTEELPQIIRSAVTQLVPSEVDSQIKNGVRLAITGNNRLSLKKDGQEISYVNLPSSDANLIKANQVTPGDYMMLTNNATLASDTEALTSKAVMKIIGQTVGWVAKEIDNL